MNVERETTEDLLNYFKILEFQESRLKYLTESVEALRLLAVQAENELHKRGVSR